MEIKKALDFEHAYWIGYGGAKEAGANFAVIAVSNIRKRLLPQDDRSTQTTQVPPLRREMVAPESRKT
jgi:hypothetical protein